MQKYATHFESACNVIIFNEMLHVVTPSKNDIDKLYFSLRNVMILLQWNVVMPEKNNKIDI